MLHFNIFNSLKHVPSAQHATHMSCETRRITDLHRYNSIKEFGTSERKFSVSVHTVVGIAPQPCYPRVIKSLSSSKRGQICLCPSHSFRSFVNMQVLFIIAKFFISFFKKRTSNMYLEIPAHSSSNKYYCDFTITHHFIFHIIP